MSPTKINSDWLVIGRAITVGNIKKYAKVEQFLQVNEIKDLWTFKFAGNKCMC